MRTPPRKLMLLCLASGICSGLAGQAPGQAPFFLPGIFFGLLFLMQLPGLKKQAAWKQAVLVLASGAICLAAIKLAIQIASSKGGLEWLGYLAAGALGAALLHLLLDYLRTKKTQAPKLLQSAVAGALLGLAFTLKFPASFGETAPLCFYFSAWQLGMGWVLYHPD